MSDALSAYEKQRLANIAANNAVLASLNLSSATLGIPQRPAVPAKKKLVKKPRKAAALPTPSRKSSRLEEGPAPEYFSEQPLADEERASRRRGAAAAPRATPTREDRPAREKPADKFGEIAGFPVGSGWEFRGECCADLVHRATVAGIVGREDEGCYSIVLNGGYADDLDLGSALTYTGSGGRSLKGTAANPLNLRTGPQTHSQTLVGKEGRYNAALYKSYETGKPVRVVRGYKLESEWRPLGVDYGGKHNYRYDGLYKVVEAWEAPGVEAGGRFTVWKFALKRLGGQLPIPRMADERAEAEAEAGEEGPRSSQLREQIHGMIAALGGDTWGGIHLRHYTPAACSVLSPVAPTR